MTVVADDAPAPVPASLRMLLVAGEASGDMHGADLVRALRRRVASLDVVGVGGTQLRAAGMRTIADVAELGAVGVSEVWRGLREIWAAYRELRRQIREERPDVCVFIDFPEFNLRLARFAKRLGVPVLYYIGPQVWAWRRRRARTIGRSIDRLAVVFPFEAEHYTPWLDDVHFVGHPLIDRVRTTGTRADTLAAAGLDPDRTTIVVLPGSRRSEIRYMLPPFLDAIETLASRRPDFQFVIAQADTLDGDTFAPALAARDLDVPVVPARAYDLVAAADVALVTSGTATLECALLERPMVIAYRLSRTSAALGRLLIRGVEHIGMPNIVAGREVVPEFIQNDVTGAALADAIERIATNPAVHHEIVEGLQDVRRRLGAGGAADRVAELTIELAEERRQT